MVTAARHTTDTELKRNALHWERSGNITFAEYCASIHDGEKADLLNGVIYMASPDNTDNSDLQSWLQALLFEFIGIYRLGKLFTSRVAFKLNNKNAPEPDIAFVSAKEAKRIKRGYVEGPPDLAIEIVSPESVYRDYYQKREIYEKAGVLEYWIIDPDEKKATFYIRKGSRYVEGKVVKHYWHSQVLKGLSLDVRWFWSAHRPRIFDVLRTHYYPEKNGS